METTSSVITKDFLKTVLETYLKRNVIMSNFETTNASVSGDSFCSQMERITVRYFFENGEEDSSLSAIAKYLPQNEYLRAFLSESKVFDCELEVYEDILPKLLKFGGNRKIAPLAYYTSMKPLPIVVLEDLLPMNYKIYSRRDGLDLEHCLLAVEKLAYFHAASVALHEQDSTVLPKFNQPALRDVDQLNQLISLSYDEAIQTCEAVAELFPFVEKLKRNKNRILSNVRHVPNIESKFMVLNHGDFWIKNFLFCYKEGKLEDVVFIDFQSPCFFKPLFGFAIFSSIEYQLKSQKEYKTLLKDYFETLVKYLKKMNVRTFPTREGFDNDFRLMACYGLIASIVVLPLVRTSRTQGASIENLLKNDGKDNFRKHCFKEETYRAEMCHYLPFTTP